MMRCTRSLAVAAIATVALLAGCSGTEPMSQPAPAQSSGVQSSGVQSSSAPSSDAPSSASPAQPSASAEESSTAPTESSSAPQSSEPSKSATGQGQEKPSKAELVAALTQFYEKNQNVPADKAKKFATCMVDKMYTKAKTSTLRAMRDGDPGRIDKSETGLIAESGLACQPALG